MGASTAREAAVAEGRPDTSVSTLEIEGMSCASCVARVEHKLQDLAGVTGASVNLETEAARVEYDSRRVALRDLEQAVVDAGYHAREAAADGGDRRARKRAEIAIQKRLLIAASQPPVPEPGKTKTRPVSVRKTVFKSAKSGSVKFGKSGARWSSSGTSIARCTS